MGKRIEQYKNKARIGVYKKIQERQTHETGGKVIITIANIMEIIEEVLTDVFKKYDVFREKDCNCNPDMDMVKQVALQEGMTTHQILKLCSQIAASAKGQYD